MSDLLRNPWLLHTVLEDLSAADGLSNSKTTPRLVQILQFMSSGTGSTHILAHLSDKFHYIMGFFTDSCIAKFNSRHMGIAINDVQGSLVRLTSYRYVKVPTSNFSGTISGIGELDATIILVIEDFELVSVGTGDGSVPFGDPRYIMCNPAVRTMISQPAPASPSKQNHQAAQDKIDFAGSLDPSDLLFLASMCTQTFESTRVSFPVVIRDEDWRIPADQEFTLLGIQLSSSRREKLFSDDESEVESETEPASKQAKTTQTSNNINASQPNVDLMMMYQTQPVIIPESQFVSTDLSQILSTPGTAVEGNSGVTANETTRVVAAPVAAPPVIPAVSKAKKLAMDIPDYSDW